ncbi:PAS domain S-box protein [Nodosilinea nodulosa]|uniref:PAS domain S-box protein n=1 Tax=Nodosilinea nodulosa TaxID=416001 RepID=UPI000314DCDC|nr:PAS domain S-box protein [Nodosilinea nodulosa]
MKILVVEHEPIVAQALKLLLVGVAYRVEVAEQRTALHRAGKEAYDLIVLDGAAELGAELRVRRPQVPILLLGTGGEDAPSWATATLAKPVDAADLVARVSALLAQPTALTSPVVEQGRSEAALRASEDNYRLLFEAMDEGFCVIELVFDAQNRPIDYCFLDINLAFEEQTNLVGAKGKYVRELIPTLETSWFETFGRVALSGEPVRFESHVEEMGRWFDVFAFRFGAPDRRQVALLFRDVTERRQAEAALQESERKLRAVFDSSFEFMGLLTVDGTVVDANQTALAAIACDRAAVIGQPFWKTPWWANVPEQQLRLQAAIQRAAAGESVQMETHHIWADGSLAWIDFSIKPVMDETGQVVLLVPEGRDITGRKEAERKIREQAALLDIASDAISVRDLEHHILYWNQGAERLFGWRAEEALGQAAYDLLRSETGQYSEMLPTLMERGEWRGEIEKFTKTSQTLTVAARWTLVNDEVGQPKFILSVETDITEKKALEAQFYQAQRLESLGRLASGIAHDLNNVFTPIVTIAQLLRLTQRQLGAKAQDQLRLLEESAKRGASMVQQILSITRSSGGARTEVDLVPVLQDLGHMLEQSLPRHIDLRLPGFEPGAALSPLRVSADPTHLHQVLMNLCINARDAMPKGGTLTIAAEPVMVDAATAQAFLDAQVGQYVRLTVTDTGTGIDPEVRDRIFDPFFTTKPPGQGTGLGLATVLGIVRASGGFLQVLSEVDRGTQVQVYLPALSGSPPDDTLAADPDDPHLGQGETLLLVEDDAAVQQAVRSLLTSYNYSVLVANDGFEAIDCLAQHQPHLVVLDVMMPGMDGLTLIPRLKAIRPSLQLIATSGLPTYHEPALAAGASAFLLKPYDLGDLLTTLSALIN